MHYTIHINDLLIKMNPHSGVKVVGVALKLGKKKIKKIKNDPPFWGERGGSGVKAREKIK